MDTDTISTDLLNGIKNNKFDIIREKCEKLPDPSSVFHIIYENIDSFKQEIRPEIIITTAKYSAWDSQVRDRLVNAVACAAEVGMLC